MKALLASCLSAVALAACASDPVPREAASSWSEGYTQRALSADRYLVDYRMEGSDYQRAYDLALWRAAQLTLEHGYPAFEVVSRDSDTDVGSRPSTSFALDRGISYQRSCGLLGCSTYAAPSYNTVQVNDSGRRASRVVSLEILLTRDGAAASSNHYDAATIVNNAERYH